jgi:hypothetical protein
MAQICFASGTTIRTNRGDVAVETLEVGDLAVTASGAHRPIKWLGHRTLDCGALPDPREAWPIRIEQGAFGPSKPERDLFVSSEHAICVGGALVPVSALVNGSSIAQVAVDAVTYWHVELESHDVLLANNLPAESFLDMGNRAFFQADGPPTLAAAAAVQLARRFENMTRRLRKHAARSLTKRRSQPSLADGSADVAALSAYPSMRLARRLEGMARRLRA